MVAFPESKSRYPVGGYDNTPIEAVKRTPPEAGNTYLRDVWGALRFVARMEFMVSNADAAILWAFYETNRLAPFTFFDFTETYSWTKNIGTGNGVITTFTIPGKSTVISGLTVNGVAKTLGVHYTYSAGTGSDGQDQIIFTGGNTPAAGHAIVLTATSIRRAYTVNFAETPSRKTVSYNRVAISMRVEERFPLAA